jgi:hypothetical protein
VEKSGHVKRFRTCSPTARHLEKMASCVWRSRKTRIFEIPRLVWRAVAAEHWLEEFANFAKFWGALAKYSAVLNHWLNGICVTRKVSLPAWFKGGRGRVTDLMAKQEAWPSLLFTFSSK